MRLTDKNWSILMPEPIKVFISYSHQDDALRKEFVSHLSGLQQHQGLIELWHDRDISAGSDWEQQIDVHLQEADIILFLVSSAFIQSRYCQSVEMTHALERHQQKTARTIPIFVRPSYYEGTALKSLQGLPRDAKPVASEERQTPIARDSLWLEIVRELGQIAQEMQEQVLAEQKAEAERAALDQYRKVAKQVYEDGDISPGEQRQLDLLAQKYKLSSGATGKILDEVMAKYGRHQSALQDYRQMVLAEIEHRNGMTDGGRLVLIGLRSELDVSEGEATQIETEVEQTWEEQRQLAVQEAKRRVAETEQQEKLKKYRESLQQALSDGYPLDEAVESGLNSFQISLGLTDGDVAPIRAELLEPAEAAYQTQLRQQAVQRKKEEQLREQQRQEEAIKQRNQNFADKGAKLNLRSFSFDVVLLDDQGKEKNRSTKQAQFFAESLATGVDLEMVAIPGGSFQMGSPDGEGDSDERPQHLVTVPAFYMGKYPVTQAEWRAVASLPKVKIDLNSEPSNFKGDRLPVEQVAWYEAVEFCDRLSRKTGKTYRLPSEAEWEYACRAGTSTKFHFGNTISRDFVNYNAGNVATFVVNWFRKQTSDFGSFGVANSFGLFDMHGNVWEWCLDTWHRNYEGALSNGSPWITEVENDERLLRGGSWYYSPGDCRSASRLPLYAWLPPQPFRFSGVVRWVVSTLLGQNWWKGFHRAYSRESRPVPAMGVTLSKNKTGPDSLVGFTAEDLSGPPHLGAIEPINSPKRWLRFIPG